MVPQEGLEPPTRHYEAEIRSDHGPERKLACRASSITIGTNLGFLAAAVPARLWTAR